MKRTIISSLIATSALLSGTAQAESTVAGGTVNFVGELVSSACALDTSSANQTVQMGQVRTSNFTKKGDKSTPVAFKIVLTDCKAGVTDDSTTPSGGTRADDGTVTIGFTAVQEGGDGNNSTIALAPGAGGAKGIGLQIVDRTSTPVKLDGSATASVKLNDDRVEIPFQAAYIATSDKVTSGKANTTALFTLTYQ